MSSLLDDLGLTSGNKAAKYCNYAVSAPYIIEMRGGRLPEFGTALRFLSFFPVDKASECMAAAGFPVPAEWQSPTDPVEAVALALRAAEKIPEEGKRQILDLVREVKAKYEVKKPDAKEGEEEGE